MAKLQEGLEKLLELVKKLFTKIITNIPQAAIAVTEKKASDIQAHLGNKDYGSAWKELTDPKGFVEEVLEKIVRSSIEAIFSEIESFCLDIQKMLNEEPSSADK